jgi:hypothetical protein
MTTPNRQAANAQNGDQPRSKNRARFLARHETVWNVRPYRAWIWRLVQMAEAHQVSFRQVREFA